MSISAAVAEHRRRQRWMALAEQGARRCVTCAQAAGGLLACALGYWGPLAPSRAGQLRPTLATDCLDYAPRAAAGG